MVAEARNPEELLTLADVAADLKVSHEQARKHCLSGQLRHINVGVGNRTEYRVKRCWLEAFKDGRDSHARQAAESARRTARRYARAPMDFFTTGGGGRGR